MRGRHWTAVGLMSLSLWLILALIPAKATAQDENSCLEACDEIELECNEVCDPGDEDCQAACAKEGEECREKCPEY